MNDFIGTKEGDSKEGEEKKEVENSTISVGGEDYTQEQLDELVGLGKIGLEVQEKHNTDLSRVFPEYTKSRQELKEVRQELEDLRNKPAPVTTEELSVEDEVTRAKALKAAADLGIMTKDDLEKAGYVSKDDLAVHVREVMAGQELAKTTLGLEKEIDGKDGRPAFVADDVLSYMEKNGLGNIAPSMAYEIMNKDALDTWKVDKATQLKKDKSSGFSTIDESAAGGAKEPEPLKVTADNFDEMVARGMKGEFTEGE